MNRNCAPRSTWPAPENQTLRDQVTELMRRLMDTQPRPKQED